MPRSWSGWTTRSSGGGRRSRPRGSRAIRSVPDKGHFVKASGRRWVCLPLLARAAWAGRSGALPDLSVLAPSERYDQERGRRHKTLPDWARQMIRHLRRWVPERALVVVADRTSAALELLADAAGPRPAVAVVTRPRLDAARYDPAPARAPGTVGRPRRKGARQPTLGQRASDPATAWVVVTVPWYGGGTATVELATGTAIWYHGGLPPVAIRWVLVRTPAGDADPHALLCTDPAVLPSQIVGWFVLRWQLEVTFHEVRAHLGVETQRQWSDLAIPRTTPALLGLFSLVALLADALLQQRALPVRQAAWYRKTTPTFVDALALVRQHLWPVADFSLSSAEPDLVQIPRALFDRLTETLAFAA